MNLPRRIPAPAWWAAGVPLAWLVAAATLPSGLPAGVVLQGVVLGSLTGLSACGLVLVHRAARVVNFAQAALGSAAAMLALQLFQTRDWNYYAALGAGVVVAAVVGALCDRLVVARLFWAPRLVLTVATIGLAQVLGGIELAIPGWFGQSSPLGGALSGGFETPLDFEFTVAPLRFTGAHVMVLGVVPAVAAALALFLRRSAVGVGIRAAAANPERAMLLGIPVRRLSMVVWAVAGALSALSAMLAAPLVGQGSTLTSGPSLLLPALAAAVIARMASLPGALLAGMGVGVFQQAVFWNTSRSSYTDVGLLFVVLGGLLLQRHRLSRADDALGGTWSAAAEAPPVPPILARLPEIVWGRRLVIGGLLAAALVAPHLMRPSQISLLGSVTIVYAIVAVSLVVLTGWAGQISLGQFAIAGLGAATTGDLVTRAGADLLVALVAGAAAGCVAALLIGLPALRVRGLFLAVATLAFAVPMSSFALNPANFPSLIPTQIERSMLLRRFDLADERTLYYFCLAVLVLVLVLVTGIRNARPGRAMVAVRDNERAAAARGIRPGSTKLAAFAVSGALAGLAGGLHAVVLSGVRSGSFGPAMSFEAFAMIVLGGATSLGGALMGAVFLRWAQYALTGALQLIVTGAGVLVVLLVLPGGLAQLAAGARHRWYRWVALHRGVDLDKEALPGESTPVASAPPPGVAPAGVSA
jgi:branched-chain amino acid transport system permease protein